MKYVDFTDESRATLDSPDGWAKEEMMKKKKDGHNWRKEGGGIMIWAGIIEFIVPLRVPQGIKLITSATY